MDPFPSCLTYPRWIQWTREFPDAATRLLALTLTPATQPVHPVIDAYSGLMLKALQAYAAGAVTADPDPVPQLDLYS